MLTIKRNVAYTQAASCRLCLHIGSVAMFIGRKPGGYGSRLELFTPMRWFRWSPAAVIALVIFAAAHAQAQQYVQNGTILYERYSASEPYIWCGRTYYRSVWKYRQVLNYAAADWRQKALDLIDRLRGPCPSDGASTG